MYKALIICSLLFFCGVHAQLSKDSLRSKEAFYIQETEADVSGMEDLRADIQAYMAETGAEDFDIEIIEPKSHRRKFKVYFYMRKQAEEEKERGFYVFNSGTKLKSLKINEKKIELLPGEYICLPYSSFPKIEISTGGFLGTRLKFSPSEKDRSRYYLIKGFGLAKPHHYTGNASLGFQAGDFEVLPPDDAKFYVRAFVPKTL